VKHIICIATLGLMLVGCQNKVREFLGPTAISILKRPAKVEAWRIHSDDKGLAQSAAAPKILTIEQGEELANILQDSRTYNFDSAKGCIFQPTVGLRIWRNNHSFEVILCFHCSELKVNGPDAVKKEYASRIEDFDEARPKLVALVKQVFPDDVEIQALK
jgi:hypothetical protein